MVRPLRCHGGRMSTVRRGAKGCEGVRRGAKGAKGAKRLGEAHRPGRRCATGSSDGQEEGGNRDENEQESSRYPEQADIGIHFSPKEIGAAFPWLARPRAGEREGTQNATSPVAIGPLLSILHRKMDVCPNGRHTAEAVRRRMRMFFGRSVSAENAVERSRPPQAPARQRRQVREPG